MTEFEMAQARIVELEAQLKKCREVIKEEESKNNILQQRLDMSNSCCKERDNKNKELLAKIAELECKIREMTECKNTHIARLEKDLDEAYKKSSVQEFEFKTLREQFLGVKAELSEYKKRPGELSDTISRLKSELIDERTKNEECMNIITELTKAVLNLSDVIE